MSRQDYTHFGEHRVRTRRGIRIVGRFQWEQEIEGWEPGTPFKVERLSRRRHILRRLTEEEAGDPRTRRARGIRHVSRRVRGSRVKSVFWVISPAFRRGAIVAIRVTADAIELRELKQTVERLASGRRRLKFTTLSVIRVTGFEDEEHVRRVAEALRQRLREQARFTVGDTFSGIGGTHLGFVQAGFRTIWAVDWSPKAERLFRLNFPEVPYYAMDIREFSPRALGLESPDILISTFPCDDISRIRRGIKRREGSGIGLAGSQSGLIRETLRIITEIDDRLKVVFLENTPDLPSLNGGRDLAYLEEELARRGFPHLYHTVLPALGWAPQRRPRWYAVASSEPLALKIPEPNPTPTRLGDILLPDHEVPDSYNWTPGMVRHFERRLSGERDAAGGARTARPARNFKPIIADYDSPYAATLTENGWKGNETSVIIRRPSGILRKMTQREMARYQTFPDTYRLPPDLSWTAAHQLFGNSVVVRVIREWALRIRDALIDRLVKREAQRLAMRPLIVLC